MEIAIAITAIYLCRIIVVQPCTEARSHHGGRRETRWHRIRRRHSGVDRAVVVTESGVTMHQRSTIARLLAWLAVTACIVTHPSFLPAQPVPAFVPLGSLPSASDASYATAVSADGSVVVGYGVGAGYGVEAFRWTSSTGIEGLGDLPGGDLFSQAFAVSADGSVIVGHGHAYSADEAYRDEAFRWENGNMVGLGDLPGGTFSSQAFGVSGNGAIVVGYSNSGVGMNGNEAFRWTQSTGMTGLGRLPGSSIPSYANAISADGNVIVGNRMTAAGLEATRLDRSGVVVGLGELPGGLFSSYSTAASWTGSVVIGTSDATVVEAFRWTACDGIGGLGHLNADDNQSVAYGVSGDGTVVVGYSSVRIVEPTGTYFEHRAIVWDDLRGMRDLRSVLVNEYGLDLSGWTLFDAAAISADGRTIVGHGRNPAGLTETWLARIPTLPCTRGDLNGDGQVTVADVPPFIATLLDPCSASNGARCASDITADSDIDGSDVQGLLSLLMS